MRPTFTTPLPRAYRLSNSLIVSQNLCYQTENHSLSPSTPGPNANSHEVGDLCKKVRRHITWQESYWTYELSMLVWKQRCDHLHFLCPETRNFCLFYYINIKGEALKAKEAKKDKRGFSKRSLASKISLAAFKGFTATLSARLIGKTVSPFLWQQNKVSPPLNQTTRSSK